jgi:hypothetical protein
MGNFRAQGHLCRMIWFRVKISLGLVMGLLAKAMFAQAQVAYPEASWPSLKKPAKADYQLSREEFLKRHGITDSAVAIIKMFYDKSEEGRKIQKQPRTLEYRPDPQAVAVGKRRSRRWSSKNLYKTLYSWRTDGGLPGRVKNRLPVYLERLMELKKNKASSSEAR